MSIAERLAKVIYDHSNEDIDYYGCLTCGQEPDRPADWQQWYANHLAAILVNLPGIAIVDAQPGTCVDDPDGTHRWLPTESGVRCVDCSLRTEKGKS